jgi:4-amino-4-deoxy-L-arabinose transferase-like glycosyltransferase
MIERALRRLCSALAQGSGALPSWTGILLVCIGAAALRLWSIGAGLPYRVSPDEPVIADHAISIMRTGNFNPHFYDYPGLYIYAQVLIGSVRFVTGAMSALWRSLDQFRPEHLFLWSRLVNAFLGCLTVLLLYRSGLRWGRAEAVVAAALLAAWPNHVRESHFALTDTPLTLLTTLTLLLSLRAHETGRAAWFLAAGSAAGFAAATKYSGAVALVMPLVAAMGVARSGRGRAVGGAVAAAGVAFAVGAPYTFLDLPGFLNGVGDLAIAYRPRPLGDGTLIYFGHLSQAAGWSLVHARWARWSALIVAVAGLVCAGVRAARRREPVRYGLIAVFPLIYFYLIATKNLIFARYLLPIVPFLCLWIALIVVDLVGWLSRRRWPLVVRLPAGVAVIAFITLPPVGRGVEWPLEYGRRTTQDIAYEQIRRTVPMHAVVAVERDALRLPDSLYRGINAAHLTDRSLEEYVSAGVTFFVASSDAFGPIYDHPDRNPVRYRLYRRLLDDSADCLPAITPTPTVSGPTIRICRLRPS